MGLETVAPRHTLLSANVRGWIFGKEEAKTDSVREEGKREGDKNKKGGWPVITLATLTVTWSLSHWAPPALAIAWREKCSEGEQQIRTCGSCHPTLTPSVFAF